MKKVFLIFTLATFAVFTACNNNPTEQTEPETEENQSIIDETEDELLDMIEKDEQEQIQEDVEDTSVEDVIEVDID